MGRLTALVTATAAAVVTVGCQPATPPSRSTIVTAPSSRPTTAAAAVEVTATDLRVTFPAGWVVTHPNPTQTQAVAPAPALGETGGRVVLTLDVPVLPFHIPYLLPIDRVASGYADDVAKRMPDATGSPPSEVTVPGATAQRVTRTGHDSAGRVTTEDAVLMVHGDHVYVLVADADPASRATATAALAAAVASVSWVR